MADSSIFEEGKEYELQRLSTGRTSYSNFEHDIEGYVD